ncbi:MULTISPECIES: hypothetical protein [Streptomyces]|uniref:hypothetical protein n=1 Tax=Streptomyces TaxID=1883 RepID=UPI00167B78C0|nr:MULTISPECIES: hypothetical protein [Streptomyces]MBK3522735.1 hypothetical protein [Streptomyces sp. MBT70]GGR58435.1 hypothetical protein GCM10010236_08540 [Streptomyces eurythermus]
MDVASALQESASEAKVSRGDAGPVELPQPKKKAAAKKRPAKQTGAKNTAGRRPRSA